MAALLPIVKPLGNPPIFLAMTSWCSQKAGAGGLDARRYFDRGRYSVNWSTEQLTASRPEMRPNADSLTTDNGISFAHANNSVTRIPRPHAKEPRRVVYDKVLFTAGDCFSVRISVFRC